MVEISKVFAENGIKPISVGNSVAWVTTIPYSYILLELDPDIFDKMNNNSVSYDDLVFIEVAKKLEMLVDEGVFGENFNGIAPAESRAEFIEGKAAMFVQATWNLPALNKDMSENVGVIPFPTVNGNNSFVLKTSPPGYAISQNTEHKEEVIQFYKFMMSEERLRELADDFSVILPWNSIEVSQKSDNTSYNDVVKAFAEYNTPFDLVKTYTVNSAIEKEVEIAIQAITGGSDIQTIFEKLEKYRKQNSEE
ncbi:ABC transporter substrate-binding protein [Clostridium grantii]|uniref:ABC transporter substrate-binding protein n=1 Tax=Clostridium grantii TaxID=40575 RepID=UPI0013564E37|nr:extracellular solute-binding protein [Clostridium grantii]